MQHVVLVASWFSDNMRHCVRSGENCAKVTPSSSGPAFMSLLPPGSFDTVG